MYHCMFLQTTKLDLQFPKGGSGGLLLSLNATTAYNHLKSWHHTSSSKKDLVFSTRDFLLLSQEL